MSSPSPWGSSGPRVSIWRSNRPSRDLRDIWNRDIDGTHRPEILKFYEEPDAGPVQ
jgi:hypothetical protein